MCLVASFSNYTVSRREKQEADFGICEKYFVHFHTEEKRNLHIFEFAGNFQTVETIL